MSTINGTTPTGKVLSPSKLAHVVLQSGQLDRMKQFYTNFLGGRIVYESEFIVFITYDDEHHRIAVVSPPGTGQKEFKSAGLVHIAYTFKNLKELCTAYRQRKALGMEPGWCVNHGPTTSFYYQDPDGNQLEIQVDNCSPHEATAYMMSAAYAKSIFGEDIDPEELSAAIIDRGEDEEGFKKPKDVGPRGPEEIEVIERMMRAAPTGV